MSRQLLAFLPRLFRTVAPVGLLAIGATTAAANTPFSPPTYGNPIQPVAYRTYADEEEVVEEPADPAPECLSCNDTGGCDACCTYPCYCWYVSLSGAWSTRETVHEEGDPATWLTFNDGFAINAAIGHEFELFRLEFEYSYLNNQIIAAGAGVNGVDYVGDATGNISVKAYMLNVYHDFDFGSRLKPYVGAGIGLFQSEINSLYPSFFPDLGAAYYGVNTTSDVGFCYQFRAGVN
jgi:hypothetical protein